MKELTLYIEWLDRFKNENKISFSKLGETIKYSDVGISKAIKNKTLTVNQVLLIAEKFNVSKELEKFVLEKENKLDNIVFKDYNKMSEDELSLFLLKNQDRILNNEAMKLIIYKKAVSIAKDLIVDDIKKSRNRT